jgi:hypothetical protein
MPGKIDNSSGTRRARHVDRRLCLEEMQAYDTRNDEALPDLQTAIDQKDAHRNCTVRVRKACLAGLVAERDPMPRSDCRRFSLE